MDLKQRKLMIYELTYFDQRIGDEFETKKVDDLRTYLFQTTNWR